MRFAVSLIPVAVLASLFSPAAAQTGESASVDDAATTTVIVEISEETPALPVGWMLDVIGRDDVERVASFGNLGLLALDVTEEGADLLARTPVVESVETARSFELFLDESVPAIGVADLHTSGHTGAGGAVAVLDSGIDTSRVGTVVSEACFLQGSPTVDGATIAQGCGNGAGLTGASASPCTALAEECSHGTHVAGIISGDDLTFTGVAPDAGLISIRVTAVIDDGGLLKTDISETAVLAGLDHLLTLASTFDIAAVNLSLGGRAGNCRSNAWESAVANLNAAGIAVVAASGNSAALSVNPDPNVAFPACLDDVVAVGATSPTPEVADFTQYLGGLNLVAPGVLIDSTVLTGLDPSGFSAFTGTSMAAPHVAGAFALVQGAQSGWSVERVMELFRSTGAMTTRVTADTGDRDPRFPELRPASVLGFTPFTDASNGYWVIASDWAKATGVSTGTGGGVFDPDLTLTRAQAVTFLWRLMGETAPTIANPFSDVPAGAYYADAVVWAAEVDITTGTTPTTFEPDGTVTRSQVAAFLWRLVGEPSVPQPSGFADLVSWAYYVNAVDWMAWHQLTTGTSPTTFSPDEIITRAQMITFLWRLANTSDAWSGPVVPPDSVMF